MLLCAMCGYAQSRMDEYGCPATDDDDLAPAINTDTTLFYRAIRQADDLYAQVAGHRLWFVANRRRNAGYGQTEVLYAGIRLPAQYGYTLRSAGARRTRLTAYAAVAGGAATTVGSEEYTYFDDDARRPSSVGVTFTDRGYSAGIRATLSAVAGGSRAGRWYVDAAVDARSGRDLHVDGVFTNAAGVTLRVARRTAGGSEFSLLLSAEPSERGLRTASSAEAFALTGDNLYNPSWGWQNGRQRNSRVRREAIPAAVASYSCESGSTALRATVAARIGQWRQSSLGWYDASTPMPDNYRYMPSYFTGAASAEAVAEAWRSGDARYTQIDWEELYAVNRMSDRGAVYALEERVQGITAIQAAVSALTRLGDGLTVGYGIEASYESTRSWCEMSDLLGGTYIVDIDYYLVDDDTFGNSLQNDLRNPDRMIRQGDRFGYDYALVRRTASVFATAGYIAGAFDLRFAGRLGGESDNRRGYFEKELFAGSGSYGDSRRLRFTTYSAALSGGYTFSPRLRIGATLHAGASAPDLRDMFLNPRYNNRTVDHPSAVRRYGAELTAAASTRGLRMQATLFAESQRDGSLAMQYYDDLAGAFCDMTAEGIGILAYGIEAAAAIRIAQGWHIDASVTAMQCRYASDPTIRIFTDSTNAAVDPGSPSHAGGCTPGGVPRLAASVAAGYFSPRRWSFEVAAAWAGARRVEPSLLRRTERVAYQGASSPEAFAAIVTHESLADAFNVDFTVAKRWLTGRNSRITASLAVRNLLGTRDIIRSGYESHRVRRIARGIQSDYAPLPTRYLYGLPRTVTLAATYSF